MKASSPPLFLGNEEVSSIMVGLIFPVAKMSITLTELQSKQSQDRFDPFTAAPFFNFKQEKCTHLPQLQNIQFSSRKGVENLRQTGQ
mmetsp:Transcript_47917/g.124422  ORF Transcript_47917/g.124422 Transcript_47917/m.124422 type:complete len:87 (+) Transcript_47917:228-488(+)